MTLSYFAATKGRAVILSLVAVGLAGCTATSTGPQPTVRQTVETAPADLQLACATEAQKRFNIKGNILPFTSSLKGAQVYSVGLKSRSSNYVCAIDRRGSILSISKA